MLEIAEGLALQIMQFGIDAAFVLVLVPDRAALAFRAAGLDGCQPGHA